MTDKGDVIRMRVLVLIRKEIETLEREADRIDAGRVDGRSRIDAMLDSIHLSRIDTKMLWWATIENALESGDRDTVLSANQRLIERLWWRNFYWTWLAPLSGVYFTFGIGPMISGQNSYALRRATALRDHYQHESA